MFKDIQKHLVPIAKRMSWQSEKAAKSTMNYARSRPKEVKITLFGAGTGVGIGYAIGGSIGVVGFFGGVGIPWVVLLALSGGVLGNRIGIAKDKKKIDELRRKQQSSFRDLLAQYEAAVSDLEKKEADERIEVLSTQKEHRDRLIHALKTAEDKVVILCGWATSYVVDAEFQSLLAKALRRGVNVVLGYGYQSASEPEPLKKHEFEAEKNLLALKEWCVDKNPDGIFVIKKFPNHAKILICDNKYAVNGSFNWLSNAGRSRNTERSWVIKDKAFVEAEMEIILNELAAYNDRRDFLKKFVPWNRH